MSGEFLLLEFSRLAKSDKNKGSSDIKKLNDGEFMEKERLHQKKYHVLVEKLSKAESKRESFKQGQESGNRTMKLKDLC